MKTEDASKLHCPFINDTCITTTCMLWIATATGKVEVDSQKVPYDLTPMGERDWRNHKKIDGYVNEGPNKGGWVDVYVKYEERNEGYCSLRRVEND